MNNMRNGKDQKGWHLRLHWSVLFAIVSLICVGWPLPAGANPQGGVLVEGSATITQTSATRLDINQSSDRAVWDWQSFSIANDEHTHFQQPSSGSISLNRVIGGDPSHIFGQLTSNGRIFLVNPNGILFGPGSRVDVAGLLATTSNITNSDFMAGRFEFSAPLDTNAGIVNFGEITVEEGGLVALVAPWVENSGIITARLGSVSLVSGNNYTLDLYGDQLIQLAIDDTVLGEVTGMEGKSPQALVTNSGTITADGGRVYISVATAQNALDTVINMDGIIQAQSIQEHNGEIILNGGEAGIVEVAGLIDASGYDEGESGGQIVILGEKVGLFAYNAEETAHIDASGDTGGGTILIGGNYQGQGPEPNARATYVATEATIQADAVTEGDGGTVVVWADEVTKFYGSISAKGGSQSGNGGLVETSGKEHLEVIGASVDASAPNGVAGEWLLDPRNVTIQNVATSNGAFDSGSPNTFTPTGDTAVADRGTIQTSLNGGTDVTINTGASGIQNGDITVTDSITKTAGGNATLTLSAAGSIAVNELISSTNNQLGVTMTATSGSISFGGANGGITSNNGNVSMTAGTTVDYKNVTTGTGTLSVTANGGNITDSGANSVGGTTTLSASGADIVLDHASNDYNTVVVSAADNVTLVDIDDIDLGTSTISSDLNVTAGGAVTDSGNLAISGRTTIAAGSGNDITLDEAGNDFADRVFITSGNNVTLRDTNGINLSTSTISGNFNITANGLIEDIGNISVSGTTTLDAGAGNNITLDRTGNDFDTVQVTSGNNVTLRDTNGIDLGDSTISGTFNVTTNGAIINSGTLIIAGTTTLAAGAANDITLDTPTNDFSTVGITNGNNVTLVDTNTIDLATSTVSGNLDVTANGAITISGALTVSGTRSLTDTTASSSTPSSSGGATTEEQKKVNDVGTQISNLFSRDRSTFGDETGFGGFDVGSFGQLTSTSDKEEEEEEEVEEEEEDNEMI